MPEPTDQPAKPLRTWRPMVLWSAGILLALGLTWLVAYSVAAVRQVRGVLAWKVMPRSDLAWDDAVQRLGGPEKAAGKLWLYLRMPEKYAPYQGAAADMLHYCGDSGAPALLWAVSHDDSEVRGHAIRNLDGLHIPPESAVPVLVKALADRDKKIRVLATEALGRLGPAGKSAIPALEEVVKRENDEWTRDIATEALKKIRGQEPPK